METMQFSKEQINEKIGNKSWVDNHEVLAAKLNYLYGVDYFDEILSGKSMKENDAVIHFEAYPKGILLKIVKGFGGFKEYLFPLSKNEIKKVSIVSVPENEKLLIFSLIDDNSIEFKIIHQNSLEVEEFLNKAKINFERDEISIKELKERTIRKDRIKRQNDVALIIRELNTCSDAEIADIITKHSQFQITKVEAALIISEKRGTIKSTERDKLIVSLENSIYDTNYEKEQEIKITKKKSKYFINLGIIWIVLGIVISLIGSSYIGNGAFFISFLPFIVGFTYIVKGLVKKSKK